MAAMVMVRIVITVVFFLADKFVQVFGSRLVASDRERILSRVKEISQDINNARLNWLDSQAKAAH